MLNTLLESRSHRARSKGTVLTSAAFHTAVILGAAYATASGVSAHDAPEPPATVIWVAAPPSSDPVTQTHRTSQNAPTNRNTTVTPLDVHVDIPVSLPSTDVNPPPVYPSDFASSSRSTTSSPPGPGNAIAGGAGVPAYDGSQVDSPVSMIGTFRPDYPAQLRSAGVEGEVVVQFVVTESGKVDGKSIRIVSASNDLFASSVTSSLVRMRFIAARMGDNAVPQLVQQTFVFRLDR